MTNKTREQIEEIVRTPICDEHRPYYDKTADEILAIAIKSPEAAKYWLSIPEFVRIMIIATKYCPIDHNDWSELKEHIKYIEALKKDS